MRWDGEPRTGDLVTISLPEAPVGGGTAATYHPQTGAQLTAPAAEGEYLLRYLSGNRREVLGTQRIEVAPALAAVAAPATVEGNQVFPVRWSGPAGPGDRIVLVDPKAGSRAPAVLSHANATGGAATQLRAPAESGEYEVLYRTAQGTALARQRLTVAMEPVVLQVRGPVKAGKPFQVQFTGSTGPGDVITYQPAVGPKGTDLLQRCAWRACAPGRTVRARPL